MPVVEVEVKEEVPGQVQIGDRKYLVFCPFPPCKHRYAATLKAAEVIARKFAQESGQDGAPVVIYEQVATARLAVEVYFTPYQER